MAALLPKRSRRKRSGVEIRNVYVDDGGRRYRVCFHGTILLFVALKCSAGGERILKHESRRTREIVARAEKASEK